MAGKRSWPMTKDLPERPGVKHANGCPVRAWEAHMGRSANTAGRVDGPLMPANEVGIVCMALGKQTLTGMNL
jgi:hypothetical protein